MGTRSGGTDASKNRGIGFSGALHSALSLQGFQSAGIPLSNPLGVTREENNASLSHMRRPRQQGSSPEMRGVLAHRPARFVISICEMQMLVRPRHRECFNDLCCRPLLHLLAVVNRDDGVNQGNEDDCISPFPATPQRQNPRLPYHVVVICMERCDPFSKSKI